VLHRQSREAIEGANRQSRETIASLPKEKEQAAKTIFDEAAAAGMPISMEQAFTRATAALNPAPDRYNALSNRLTAANKEISALRYINEITIQREKDPKKKETIKNDFETKRQAILRNYAISEADLIELNTAGRSSATGASAAQGQPPAQPPAQPKATSNEIPVTAPNGQTFYFKTQEAANKFKSQIAGGK
jgi:TolA-binding protein